MDIQLGKLFFSHWEIKSLLVNLPGDDKRLIPQILCLDYIFRRHRWRYDSRPEDDLPGSAERPKPVDGWHRSTGLGHRNIPEYLVGAVGDIAKMIGEFVPIARVLIGVEIEENSELDLLDWAKAHRGNRKYVAFANKY